MSLWTLRLRVDVPALDRLVDFLQSTQQQDSEALSSIQQKLDLIIAKENQIMASQQDLQVALDKIDAATTKQGQVLQQEANTLQTISDELDALVQSAQSGSITPAQLAQAQKLADATQAISDSLDAQAAFSQLIAAKGAPAPVPGPVPPPSNT